MDNLHGFQSIAECVAVYNDILHEIKDDKGNRLPSFTACTDWGHLQTEDGSKTRMIGNGARLRRVDLTTNRTVGKGNELAYIRALSTQRVGYKNGHLYEDGWTCDWQARDHYYKALRHRLISQVPVSEVQRNFGEDSPNSATCSTLAAYCDQQGVVRMEQELKSEYLARERLEWWGLFDEGRFAAIHGEFLRGFDKLEVMAMDYETIAERLLSEEVVGSTQAANATANIAMKWMHCPGISFDFTKSQMKTYRARLNRIGINIAQPYDVTRHSVVMIRRAEEIVTSDVLDLPEFYRHAPRPRHLRLVA
ncbi:phage/plasmid replication domain-containing protein [Pseudomonas aeruginosa]